MSLPLSLRADHTPTVRIPYKVVDGVSVRALCRPGRHRLHLDFRDVAFVTASGLGQLLVLHQALQARGGRLTLGHLGADLQEVFEVTHLTRVFDIGP
jgi:anti-anti-sigma factor